MRLQSPGLIPTFLTGSIERYLEPRMLAEAAVAASPSTNPLIMPTDSQMRNVLASFYGIPTQRHCG